LTYDGGAESWSPEDIQAVLASATEVQRVLENAGNEVHRIPIHPDLAWFAKISDADLVFNLCEGIGGVSQLEYAVSSAIELTQIPYTGCSAWTAMICHRKPVLNAILQAQQFPIPRWFTPAGGVVPPNWDLPSIVKPAAEDASIGIEQDSVVTTRAALLDRINHIEALHDRAFVQRYVEGREIAVGIVGHHTLPLSEIDFGRLPEGAWPIVSFSAKWHEGSEEYVGTEPVCPANVDADLAHRLVTLAQGAWQAVDGRGYGRVDFRVDADGQPWILEVNPNPDLSTNAGLARMARVFGWSYGELVDEIVQAALEPRAAHAPGTRPPASTRPVGRCEASLA